MHSLVRRFCATISPSTVIASLVTATLAANLAIAAPLSAKDAPTNKPTVVLVHGAFAESSSWNNVSAKLLAKGYPVIAVANPLRGVKSDSAYLAKLLDAVKGPVILVGHSYGGSVISNIPTARTSVKALIFVAGFAPDANESAATLAGKFPGGTLGSTLALPVVLADGTKDLYIAQEKYHAQFAADVSAAEAKLMATTQRPIAESALTEPVGESSWKTIPSYFLYGSLDKNIPAAAHAFMAKRANARRTVEVPGASHVVMMTHPDALVRLIDEASAESGSL